MQRNTSQRTAIWYLFSEKLGYLENTLAEIIYTHISQIVVFKLTADDTVAFKIYTTRKYHVRKSVFLWDQSDSILVSLHYIEKKSILCVLVYCS